MKNLITLFFLLSFYGCATHLPLNKKRILQSNTHIGQPFDAKIDTLVEYRLKKGHVKKERFSLDGKVLFYRNYWDWGKNVGFWSAFQGKKANIYDGILCTSYYHNGNPRYLSSGYPVAIGTFFYENKQIRSKDQYDFEQKKLLNVYETFSESGERLPLGTLKNGNGTFNWYDSKGKLIKIVHYVNGKKVKIIKIKSKK